MKKHVLGHMSGRDFTESYWQKEPLLIPAAFPDITGLVNKKDLMVIASKPEADARLVMTDSKQKNWQCEQGPFNMKQLKSLPSSHWTLLVQAVDQWMPAIAGLLAHFDFLPRWRLDDIMISYATEGGGVGPHFDYYDVFLLQAGGTRCWKMGQRCDEQSPLRDHADMKLLKQFNLRDKHEVCAGDLLYIPAGVAHWGTATSDDCITISIGFRAPSQGELLQMALHKIAASLPESRRYRDTDASIDRDPFCINTHAVSHIERFWNQLDPLQAKQALAQALGEYATEPRYPERIYNEQKIKLTKTNLALLQHNPASRFAWRPLDSKRAELYVDGETHQTSVKFAKAVCHGKVHPSLLRKQQDKQLLLQLLDQGSLFK